MQVDTPSGPANLLLDHPDATPNLILALGHGAGGGIEAPDLLAVRRAALQTGALVARIEQPYRVAGRRPPAPAAWLDESWVAVLAEIAASYPGLPIISGGRSSGARVACRTARATRSAAVLALAFPLTPPTRPDTSRAGELYSAGVPVLVINGERDRFGIPVPSDNVAVCVIAAADHSLRRGSAEVAGIAGRWLARRCWETFPG